MGTELLTDDQIAGGLERTPEWTRRGDAIERTVVTRDFRAAMAFVNEIADAAEEMNHHPDITIRWNTVELTLSTHSAGGLTDSDFKLASRINELAPEQAG